MADLGEAVLKLTVDDSELTTRLGELRREIESLGSAGTRSTSRSSTRSSPRSGGGIADPGEVDRLAQAARELNLNTNWGKALRVLGEVDADLALIGASQQFNLNAGWNAALQQFQEISSDLALISGGNALNLNSSWTAALQQLEEIDNNLKLVSAGESLNLNASWSSALQQLEEIDADLRLISAGDSLNLRTSWTAALQQLEEIDSDLKFIQGGKDLNLRTSWQKFLGGLQQVKADIDAADNQRANTQTKQAIRGRIEANRNNPSGFGAASRDNFGPSRQTRADQLEADLTRVKEARLRAERERLQLTERTKAQEAQSTQLAAQEAKVRRERLASLTKRLTEAGGNAVIGGAFPALFGQGAGASVGGALGGAAGGLLGGNFGFGLSLVGTAVGQRFDDIGNALKSPIKNFDTLKNAALLSSQGLERTVEALIAAGRYGEANALIQQDLQATLGDTSKITELQDATRNLNRLFTEGTLVLGNFVAGPLTEFLNKLRNPGGGTPQPNEPSPRQRASSTLLNAGIGVSALGLIAALAGAPTAGVGALLVGGAAAGISQLLQPQPPSASGTQQNMDAEIAAIRKKYQEEKSYKDLIAAENRLIVAQAQGNRTAADEAARRAAAARRDEQIQADPTQAVNAWREYERTIITINENQKQREKELTATVAQEILKRQQIAQQIGVARARRDAALAAGDSAANPGNSTLAARAGELEGASFLAQNRLRVEQAITRERELQNQLAQESDPTKRSQLAEQLKTAADELRLAGEEAGAALAERAASAAQSLRGAQDALRSTLQSNFKFLPRAQRQSLLDSARADIARGKDSGILRPNFGAAGRSRTFEAADFVRNVEQQRAQVAQQQALVEALNANTNAERNIRINVTMNADGSASVTQTEQQAALL